MAQTLDKTTNRNRTCTRFTCAFVRFSKPIKNSKSLPWAKSFFCFHLNLRWELFRERGYSPLFMAYKKRQQFQWCNRTFQIGRLANLSTFCFSVEYWELWIQSTIVQIRRRIALWLSLVIIFSSLFIVLVSFHYHFNHIPRTYHTYSMRYNTLYASQF